VWIDISVKTMLPPDMEAILEQRGRRQNARGWLVYVRDASPDFTSEGIVKTLKISIVLAKPKV